MKQFLIIDKLTMKAMGLYKAAGVNLAAMTSDRPLEHVEMPDDFSEDAYEFVLEGDKVKVKRKA